MDHYLLIDFGTTRVKSAIVDLSTGNFHHIKEYSHLPNCGLQPYQQEICISAVATQFEEICQENCNLIQQGINGIVLSSQMHGFALLDENNRPLGNYVTWKDERSLVEWEGENSFSVLAGALGESFRRITGMKPRPCFPAANLLHLARLKQLPAKCKVVTLPELLCSLYPGCTNTVHPTMIAGLALYDIYQRKIAQPIVDLVAEYSGCTLAFNDVRDENTAGGYFPFYGRKIPIYVGFGDHQCNVLGAENRPKQTISINMGTGSQVSVIEGTSDSDDVEQRPFFGGELLSTITHIPAGRALAVHAAFIRDLGGTEEVFWKALQDLKPDNVLGAELEFDLGIFSSAWRYRGGGFISNISETNWNLENYAAGLMKSLCLQYRSAVEKLDPCGSINECILSGGVPRHLPQLADILAELLQRRVVIRDGIEEPLRGLRVLALVASGKVDSYLQAYSYFTE